MDLHVHATDDLAQSHWHGFRYRVGEMVVGLDRERRLVHVAPVADEDGEVVTPAYSRGDDTPVIAVGSRTNDFGTPGVAEHAIALETPAQAPRQLQVDIIGAGATGVEPAAELRKSTHTLLDRPDALLAACARFMQMQTAAAR